MTHLVLLFSDPDLGQIFSHFGMWAFLAVGAVSLFGIFLPVTTWLENRRKEREAFYRAETVRRIAEAPAEGGKATVELLREQQRISLMKTREGMKIAGLINVGVGIGLLIFLRALVGWQISLCGLLPGFIGIAMLSYTYLLAAPLE